MTHKHLHELLKEDQEPFQLKNFIADRRSKLKSTTTFAKETSLNVRKRKPIIESSSSSATARSFCIHHACLLSFQDSPEFRKSPFLDFPTREMKSPCKNAPLFLNVPARTAAMLLDAATRVQKPKPDSKQIGFGLLGSFLRRLKDRSTRMKSRELGPVNLTPISPPATKRSRKKKVNGGGDEKRLSNSCNDSRISSGDWSEKSTELETSCSSRSIHEFEEIECICSNPSSPFRFSLHRSPSPTHRKQNSSSSVASPSRHFLQDKESYEVGCTQEIRREEDEDKKQCSPVSVLDTLFDDDDDEEHDGGGVEDDSYDIECTYANVQRAKHQLLQKLQRFERLAGLDPIKLENHMLEQCYVDDEEDVSTYEEEASNEESFRNVVDHLGVGKVPWYMKRLVSDLIEEENETKEHHVMVQRVCKRLHSWKVVELNTIDMMVETEFESEGWTRCNKETIRDVGMDIEVAIFGFLVEELAQELVGNVV